jgi:nucleoside-diphosphate-sugar epimerase
MHQIPVLGENSTILVTGAAGFIGSRLVERLLQVGCTVVGIDAFTDYYSPTLKRANLTAVVADGRFQLVEADLATADLPGLLDGVDAVCHLAGQPGVRGSWGTNFETYLRHNVLAGQRLLEALAVRPVPTVIASSSSVYGSSSGHPLAETAPLRPVSPYGMTKVSLEQLADVYRRDQELPIVVLRYFTVFGPRQRPDMAFQRFIKAAMTGASIRVFGSGEQSRDFTFVDDVVAATIAAIGAPSPVYNVGGGTPATVNEVLSLVADLTGRELHVVREQCGRGDVLHTWADTTLARNELTWCPYTSLADGLAAQLDSYRRRAKELVTV